MAPSVGHILVAFDGAERWAFFYLSFGARSLWDDMVPGSETLISGWAGANSRFAALREFAGKGLICFTICARIPEIPVSTGKAGNFAPPL